MQRVLHHRLLAALLAALSLMAVTIPANVGVASAASTSTTCPSDPFCILVISAPESVLTNQVFTVQVAVTTNGTTVATSDPCASKVLVELDVIAGESLVATYYANASAGTATFSISVSLDDFYTLEATATSPETGSCSSYFYGDDFAFFTAVTLPADEAIAPCPDNVKCVQAVGGTGSNATLIADEGTFFFPLFAPFPPFPNSDFFSDLAGSGLGAGCFPPADPGRGVLGFTHTGGGPKTIVFALSSALVKKGIGLYNICWNSATPFIPLGGGLVTTGVLPDCKKNDAGPCVLFRKSNQHNVGFFGVLVPPSDPKGYPG